MTTCIVVFSLIVQLVSYVDDGIFDIFESILPHLMLG